MQQLIATKGFQEGTDEEIIEQVSHILTHPMATEIVKLTGPEYFVDVLKAQNFWQVCISCFILNHHDAICVSLRLGGNPTILV